MLKVINNLEIENEIFINNEIKTYRVRDEQGKRFILKNVSNLNHLNTDVIYLNSEFEIISSLQKTNISLKPIKIEKTQQGYYSIFEDFEGITLKDFIKNNKQDLDIFFKISINLCQILKKIHDKGYIHKNINHKFNLIIYVTPNYCFYSNFFHHGIHGMVHPQIHNARFFMGLTCRSPQKRPQFMV